MKAYNKIKEGLIALICVGDTILHIRSYLTPNSATGGAKTYYEVFEYKVTEIEEDNILVSLHNSTTRIYFNSIHVNNGQLYIWRPPLKYYTLNENDKIKMLNDVLKRGNTNYCI